MSESQNPIHLSDDVQVESTPSKKNGISTLIIVVLLILMGVMAYLWSSTKSELSESNAQMENLSAMLTDYTGEISQNLSSDLKNMLATYDALEKKTQEQGHLNEEQAAEITAQKDQIQELLKKVEQGKWTASELAKMRKENETLRSIMKGYVQQIDSLNTLNIKLSSDLDLTRGELTTTVTERDSYKQTAEEAKAKIQKGSKLQAYSITSEALKGNAKTTNKAKNSVQIRSVFTLGANEIAEKGTKTVYLQVVKPDGTIFQKSAANVISVGNETVAYSDKKDIDYTGEAINMAIYYDLRGENAEKGNYIVKIYCEKQLIGTDNFTLK